MLHSIHFKALLLFIGFFMAGAGFAVASKIDSHGNTPKNANLVSRLATSLVHAPVKKVPVTYTITNLKDYPDLKLYVAYMQRNFPDSSNVSAIRLPIAAGRALPLPTANTWVNAPLYIETADRKIMVRGNLTPTIATTEDNLNRVFHYLTLDKNANGTFTLHAVKAVKYYANGTREEVKDLLQDNVKHDIAPEKKGCSPLFAVPLFMRPNTKCI